MSTSADAHAESHLKLRRFPVILYIHVDKGLKHRCEYLSKSILCKIKHRWLPCLPAPIHVMLRTLEEQGWPWSSKLDTLMEYEFWQHISCGQVIGSKSSYSGTDGAQCDGCTCKYTQSGRSDSGRRIRLHPVLRVLLLVQERRLHPVLRVLLPAATHGKNGGVTSCRNNIRQDVTPPLP